MLVKVSEKSGNVFFQKSIFKMIDFDTLQVMYAGTVVLASGFRCFLLFAKLNQGQ